MPVRSVLSALLCLALESRCGPSGSERRGGRVLHEVVNHPSSAGPESPEVL